MKCQRGREEWNKLMEVMEKRIMDLGKRLYSEKMSSTKNCVLGYT